MVETAGTILAEALQAIKSEASVIHDMNIINLARAALDTATYFVSLSRHRSQRLNFLCIKPWLLRLLQPSKICTAFHAVAQRRWYFLSLSTKLMIGGSNVRGLSHGSFPA